MTQVSNAEGYMLPVDKNLTPRYKINSCLIATKQLQASPAFGTSIYTNRKDDKRSLEIGI